MFLKPKSPIDLDTGTCDPDSTEAHVTTVADVEVDTETGEVKVLTLCWSDRLWGRGDGDRDSPKFPKVWRLDNPVAGSGALGPL